MTGLYFSPSEKNRRQTLNDITSKFNVSYGQELSTRTVRRRLFEEGSSGGEFLRQH